MMRNTRFISLITVLLLIFFLLTGCGPLVEEDMSENESGEPIQPRTIKLGHVLNEQSCFQIAATKFKELVEQKTEGQIKVEILPSGALGDEYSLLEGMQIGTVDMGIISNQPIARFIPEIAALEMPFLFASAEEAYQILDDIEGQQVEIDESLRSLREDEKIAQEKVEQFEFQLRNLKRYVEKNRLPGLSGDYLEFFFLATDRVEDLAKLLNKIRINMEEVNKLVAICEEELTLLDRRTKELVDAAALTEQMMQYANRYRHSHPDVKAAIQHSLVLFNQEYRYQDALDEIGTALERVEPGSFKRLETFYFNHRDLV